MSGYNDNDKFHIAILGITITGLSTTSTVEHAFNIAINNISLMNTPFLG